VVVAADSPQNTSLGLPPVVYSLLSVSPVTLRHSHSFMSPLSDFLGCPKNVLEVEPRCSWIWSLAEVGYSSFKAWVWALAAFVYFQAFLVILQNIFGPAFFIPQKVRVSLLFPFGMLTSRKFAEVKSYNYHPPMPFPEIPEQSLGDCAICMDGILLEPALGRPSLGLDSRESHAEKGSSSSSSTIRRSRGVTSVLNDVLKLSGVNTSSARKNYSLAPCCHLFVSIQ